MDELKRILHSVAIRGCKGTSDNINQRVIIQAQHHIDQWCKKRALSILPEKEDVSFGAGSSEWHLKNWVNKVVDQIRENIEKT